MGFSIRQMDSKFSIPRIHHKEALAAIKALFAGGRDQRYVKSGDEDRWTTLADALEDYSWCPKMDGDYNIVDIDFHGEKMGAEERMFEAIAPFVQDGSYIEMTGDEGAHWRWVFTDGKMKEVNAVLPWSEDD